MGGSSGAEVKGTCTEAGELISNLLCNIIYFDPLFFVTICFTKTLSSLVYFIVEFGGLNPFKAQPLDFLDLSEDLIEF